MGNVNSQRDDRTANTAGQSGDEAGRDPRQSGKQTSNMPIDGSQRGSTEPGHRKAITQPDGTQPGGAATPGDRRDSDEVDPDKRDGRDSSKPNGDPRHPGKGEEMPR